MLVLIVGINWFNQLLDYQLASIYPPTIAPGGHWQTTVPYRYQFPGVTKPGVNIQCECCITSIILTMPYPPHDVTILRLDIIARTMRWIGLMEGKKVPKNS